MPDDFKPRINSPADLSDTYVVDDGSEQLYVEDSAGNRVQLSMQDDDGDVSTFISWQTYWLRSNIDVHLSSVVV